MKIVKNVFNRLKLTLSAKGNQKFKCKICKEYHGGVYSATICHNCWAQGHR